MSWKAVEMQVAIPRTQDAGKIQDHLQQQARMEQNQLAQSILNSEARKRTQVIKQKASEQLKNNKKKNQTLPLQQEKEKLVNDRKQLYIRHPFLGSRVDFNG
ncbi:hypothetical protein SH601_13300 [Gracilibacillus sp. S3-1-1]|uniref:Uncharacterized protein n=1 Tax=Gracilibacillus pellucidus TaxID=3095368 RepID=A0ACC6M7Q4_9BACI|nr:hypothetical protein [Gracilibacillus sp. S3-1-1]MDX8046964.1 hypothetical protein [Gracilibacillus sp. S3-1-1]